METKQELLKKLAQLEAQNTTTPAITEAAVQQDVQNAVQVLTAFASIAGNVDQELIEGLNNIASNKYLLTLFTTVLQKL